MAWTSWDDAGAWRTIYLWFSAKYVQNISANFNHNISAPILWYGAGAVVVEESCQNQRLYLETAPILWDGAKMLTIQLSNYPGWLGIISLQMAPTSINGTGGAQFSAHIFWNGAYNLLWDDAKRLTLQLPKYPRRLGLYHYKRRRHHETAPVILFIYSQNRQRLLLS